MSARTPSKRIYTEFVATIPGMSPQSPRRNVVVTILYVLTLSVLAANHSQLTSLLLVGGETGTAMAVASTDCRSVNRPSGRSRSPVETTGAPRNGTPETARSPGGPA